MDLLFFDTTSTYFELDEADEPVSRDPRGRVRPTAADTESDGTAETDGDQNDGDQGGDQEGKTIGFRTYGKSKDHRPDLPQIVIESAASLTANASTSRRHRTSTTCPSCTGASDTRSRWLMVAAGLALNRVIKRRDWL